MPILDPDSSARAAAAEIKNKMREMVVTTRDGLSMIADRVATHGRAALATELAPDGAKLLSVYTAFRDACIEAGLTIPELPNP